MRSPSFALALRLLRKQPGYTFLNIAGLAVGLACCLVILLYVRDERAYDRFHAAADRVYRVNRETLEGGVATREQANTPAALGPTLQASFAGVDRVARLLFAYPSNVLVRSGERAFYEEGFLWADATVFDVFTFPLVRGDAATALNAPYSLVLTASAARKYFGTADPVGRTLTIAGWTTDAYRVTGVLADLPAHSHLQFTMLASMAGAEHAYSGVFEGEGAWVNSLVYTYVRLADGPAAGRLAAGLPAFTDRYLGAFAREHGIQLRFKLQPLTDIHLDAGVRTILETNGDRSTLYLFSAIAVFILLVACVNFVNLSTARAARRAKEVGLRKVMGAHRRQLVAQFLGEAVLLSLAAFALALALVELALPFFNDLAGKALRLDLLGPGLPLARFTALAVGVGVLAGVYPAFVLSAPAPVQVLKGGAAGPPRARLRRGLVVFQLAVTIALLAGTAVIERQLGYVRGRDLGFDREAVVVLPLRDRPLRERAETFKQALRRHPGVVGVAAASGVPGRPMLTDSWPVRRVGGDAGPVTMLAVMADPDFGETMGLRLVAGRGLSAGYETDATAAFVVNETAVRALGFARPEEALGQRLHWQQGDGKEGPIVGVVADFHYRSLHQAVEPTILHVFPGRYACLVVRLRPGDVPAALAHVEAQWKALAPGLPFEYTFVDQGLDALYRADARMGHVVALFTTLAILVACLGLFGLAAYTAEQRTKEIGIRKVMGASVAGLVVLLTADVARLVAVAFVVAAPLAYVAAHRWLDAFAYRIDPGPGLFLLAGGAALAVALLTVGTQAVRAALADPVQSLRYE